MHILIIIAALLAAALAALGYWRVHVWLWPLAPCRFCGGDGKSRGSNRNRWGTCGHCGGSGKRRRLGARPAR